ncbi:hypothetical protein TI39_contig623g00010 [Zymoseptoria brevis]|uniref:Uncharacterized protein n=1 Tax=Zymoseptoria brevis TaxID=1047168 RepID=A0A0F4GGS9_9PEZI|nr:hypothetical protein TI39_contig623g00010 [Zymoseptoria brevis]
MYPLAHLRFHLSQRPPLLDGSEQADYSAMDGRDQVEKSPRWHVGVIVVDYDLEAWSLAEIEKRKMMVVLVQALRSDELAEYVEAEEIVTVEQMVEEYEPTEAEGWAVRRSRGIGRDFSLAEVGVVGSRRAESRLVVLSD